LLPALGHEHHSDAVESVPCLDNRPRSYVLDGWDIAAVSEPAFLLGWILKGEGKIFQRWSLCS